LDADSHAKRCACGQTACVVHVEIIGNNAVETFDKLLGLALATRGRRGAEVGLRDHRIADEIRC
jgi:hypothetical protein